MAAAVAACALTATVLGASVVGGQLAEIGKDAARSTASATPATGQSRIRWSHGHDFERPLRARTNSVVGIQRVASNRIRIVRDPAGGRNRVGRFEVRQGDAPVDHNDRAEILFNTGEREGNTGVYEWNTRLAKGFPVHAEWQVLAQFHAERGNTIPPVQLTVAKGRLRLSVLGSDYWHPRYVFQIPVRTAQWYRIRLRVRWSSDPRWGFVDAWVNGRRVGKRTYGATLHPGQHNYFKIGYYRSRDIRTTAVVFHDAIRLAPRR